MKEYRIIIAGGRDFSDYDMLKDHVDKCINGSLENGNETQVVLTPGQTEIIIVSGKAKGADSLGERYAKERGYKIEVYPADWKKYGKAAGMIRNKQMAEKADALIAFWDGKSHGTKNMIDLAHKNFLYVHPICRY